MPTFQFYKQREKIHEFRGELLMSYAVLTVGANENGLRKAVHMYAELPAVPSLVLLKCSNLQEKPKGPQYEYFPNKFFRYFEVSARHVPEDFAHVYGRGQGKIKCSKSRRRS